MKFENIFAMIYLSLILKKLAFLMQKMILIKIKST